MAIRPFALSRETFHDHDEPRIREARDLLPRQDLRFDARKVGSEPVLYESKQLTTHAVCVGMTGSGKTGLCLSLLEEAAIDGIPVIAIDPKGDIGNLLLRFPELRARISALGRS